MTPPTHGSGPMPVLVAHRGYALRYPENSLQALKAAFEEGVDWVEFDIQLSADGVPFLLHDADLTRTAGVSGCALDRQWQQLAVTEINETKRLGKTFQGVCIPALQDVVGLLGDWPRKQAFVELKRASLERFGTDVVVDLVLEVLQPVLSRCVIICFDRNAVQVARNRAGPRIGWVLDRCSTRCREEAEELNPEYLFCNYKKLPGKGSLWPGPWQWVLYDVKSHELAHALGKRGARFIETGAVGELLRQMKPQGGMLGD
ncbi:MAG: glycerophosphodiester phosphodiesterase family protein [Gammaproteobacteria bacterium]